LVQMAFTIDKALSYSRSQNGDISSNSDIRRSSKTTTSTSYGADGSRITQTSTTTSYGTSAQQQGQISRQWWNKHS